MPSRFAIEAGVCLITTAVLAGALSGPAGLPSAHAGLLAFIVLGPAAILAETRAGALDKLYHQRQAGSSGLALGALALPWTFAGLAAKQHASGSNGSRTLPPAVTSMLVCVAASAAAVAALLLRVHLSRSSAKDGQTGGQRPATRAQQQAQNGSSKREEAAHTPLNIAPALVLLLAAFLLALVAPAGRGGSRWQLLVQVAAACGCLHGLLVVLPGTFTIGEALVAAQAAVLLGSSAFHQLQAGQEGQPATSPCQRFVVLLSAGSLLSAAALIARLLHRQNVLHGTATRRGQPPSASALRPGLTLSAAAVAAISVAGGAPAALWAVRLALSTRRRALLCCWWAADLAVTLPAMAWLSSSRLVPRILVRKGYHLLAVSLFLPALLAEPQLLGVALAAALTVLLALEAVRLSGLPGIAPRVHSFMTSFTDGRDAGPVLITHFTLLLGMAAPVWLSNALDQGTGSRSRGGVGAAAGWQQQPLWLAAFAGIMILGFGDTAASGVGSSCGRHPICRGSRKTVEGTAAAIAATLATWRLLVLAVPALGAGSAAASALPTALLAGGWSFWGQLAAATALSCMLEAATTQLDNVFMPLHYFALLCLL